ncbi:Aconitate hydratase precursor [Planctomycetes bacterium Pan216]|uniref:Aconitate hydratase n=1 Tax=Kolteria novifilia TaxID=2527975 RepID=A0A518B0L6_9BACT|nr:Aconitate hydratase precursor [Planctomycetes bacterium Pan216]
MSPSSNAFDAQATLATAAGEVRYYSLQKLDEAGLGPIDRLPYSIKVLLENVLRNVDGFAVTEDHVRALAGWKPTAAEPTEIPYKPARVILQDFTGVPALVDLAAMRSSMSRLGGDPTKINPTCPVDLVIDHSVQVDNFGTADSLDLNAKIEFHRNKQRYEFLRWGQKAFSNFQIVPPATGIVHQVNLEYLAKGVFKDDSGSTAVAYPDTLVGTDSHTTMINGLGVLGWGVGGIEAEAVMLGQPIYMLIPEVVGFRMTGELPEGTTATDLVLTVTEMLRAAGVVGKFVEFFGPGLSNMSLADRATIANMAPEYGATMGFFPIDDETLKYLRQSGRTDELVDLVEKYCKAQGLFRTDDATDPTYSQTLSLDLATVVPSLAGPKRPQDRVKLTDMKSAFATTLTTPPEKRGFGLSGSDLEKSATFKSNGDSAELHHGAVVIAAITSCTNTSNPDVMVAAGLVAKKAAEKGLNVKPWVKTSLAPGSRVVTNYLEKSGLSEYLDKLGFQTVGYGCTTCIGNSGPLPDAVAEAVTTGDLVATSVLSGNRNFEGRVHPLVKANYLASPPMVVAYALAGSVTVDLTTEPLGTGADGQPVMLKDVWPTEQEIADVVASVITPEMFRERYANVFEGDDHWKAISGGEGQIYEWDTANTYVQEPPFFLDLPIEPDAVGDITGARALAKLADSVTTDHISPAGAIKADGPAAKYLESQGVERSDFNSFGSRRGNDRVMTRGTFANIRLRNLLAPGTEGGVTTYLPTGEQMSIFDAAMKYKESGTPLMILAGAEYGTGSSRDWAAKGTLLLGVKAVIASSYERIHRSNLVGMGVLPLQFEKGDTYETIGLKGDEVFDIVGIAEGITPGQKLTVRATAADGKVTEFTTICRVDTPVEVEYYRNGGILQTVLRNFMKS